MDHLGNDTSDAGLEFATIKQAVQSATPQSFLTTLASTSASEIIWAFAVIFTIYQVGLIVYRLYLSPIAKYPGPKLAAASFWYEFYFDVIGFGRVSNCLCAVGVVKLNVRAVQLSDCQVTREVW